MNQLVLEGQSVRSVALANGIQWNLLSKWYKIYQHSGVEGLKLDYRGSPPKMAKKPKPPSQPKTQRELEKELEELRAKNAYLKNSVP